MQNNMWRDFFLSPEYDFLVLLVFIFLVIIGVLGIILLGIFINKKNKQNKYLEDLKGLLETISSLNGGDKMSLNLSSILTESQTFEATLQDKATSQDIANTFRGLSQISTALAGNLTRVAVNTANRRKLDDLAKVNEEVSNLAEVLSAKNFEEGEKHATNALGVQSLRQSITDGGQEEEKEQKQKTKEEEEITLSPVSSEVQKNGFSMGQARYVIRSINPLKLCIEAHGIDIKSDFDINSIDGLKQKLIAKLEARRGSMTPVDGEEDLLKFLKG
ncbi:hypothetical protein H3C61_02685 [Candidatus Gracilibacteria bacterium]|nr:hypothetical protein [Candidatus Gracilibacteria bacterium]